METTLNEITDGVFRISTFVPEVAPPAGFTFNQFLVTGDEPLLFHTGPRAMFPIVAEQVAKVIPVESLRWVSFAHVESDECGSMNMWLSSAPQAQVLHGHLGIDISLNDLCDRPPVGLADGEVLEAGDRRFRLLQTPHVPHNWESIMLFEETSKTLLCGDVFSQLGGKDVAITGDDLVEAAIQAEEAFHQFSLAPSTADTIRRAGDLNPATLAIMHGSCFAGDGNKALYDLAAQYEERYLKV